MTTTIATPTTAPGGRPQGQMQRSRQSSKTPSG